MVMLLLLLHTSAMHKLGSSAQMHVRCASMFSMWSQTATMSPATHCKSRAA